jgi:hypothetical protein
MGRGLSNLQRFLLAESNRRPRLYYADVLRHYFGFRPAAKMEYHKPREADPAFTRGDPSSWEDGGQLHCPGGQKFRPRDIGVRRYRSALASLSRACRRLQSRGLVELICGGYSHWAGVEITAKGRQEVYRLIWSHYCQQVNQ